jgi:hypothetical protein
MSSNFLFWRRIGPSKLFKDSSFPRQIASTKFARDVLSAKQNNPDIKKEQALKPVPFINPFYFIDSFAAQLSCFFPAFGALFHVLLFLHNDPQYQNTVQKLL